MSQTVPEPLTLTPPLTIRSIDGLHARLLAPLQAGRSVVLEIETEADCDLSVLQLLEAARRYARERGVSLTLSNPVGARIRETLGRAGFLSDMDADASRFWFHRKDVQ
ncbi:STAS domain-containing protein [Ensifer soli]|uniref:STAS domain-containing protein n=1 Tax=Ciceribacter sp. sgz301302 TaxID=3342379 RepID=UPI0035B9CEDC